MDPQKKLSCEFCGSKFSSDRAKIFHQQTAKKCLSERGKEVQKVLCDFCGAEFSSKVGFLGHQEICKVKETQEIYEKRLKELRETIKELKEELRNFKISTFCKKKLVSVKNIQNTIGRFISDFCEESYSSGFDGICEALEEMRVTKTGEYWRYGKSDGKILFKYIENGKEIVDDGSIKFKNVFLMLMSEACDFSGKKRIEYFGKNHESVMRWNKINIFFINSKSDEGFKKFAKTLKKFSSQKAQVHLV